MMCHKLNSLIISKITTFLFMVFPINNVFKMFGKAILIIGSFQEQD